MQSGDDDAKESTRLGGRGVEYTCRGRVGKSREEYTWEGEKDRKKRTGRVHM